MTAHIPTPGELIALVNSNELRTLNCEDFIGKINYSMARGSLHWDSLNERFRLAVSNAQDTSLYMSLGRKDLTAEQHRNFVDAVYILWLNKTGERIKLTT